MLRAYEGGEVIEPRSKHPVALLITLSPNSKLIYELRANTGLTLSLPGARVSVSRDGGNTWKELTAKPRTGAMEILLRPPDLGDGRLLLRMQ